MRVFVPTRRELELSSPVTPSVDPNDIERPQASPPPDAGAPYAIFKFALDKGAAILALPLIATIAVALFVLNPFFNPGPLFFRQPRMGRDGRPFLIWKFRTMLPSDAKKRGPEDPVEYDRIRPLGAFLRLSRLDELPNLINVLIGDMSLIGPRPDAWDHAVHFCETMPHYTARHRVRPGITGLAQVRAGYAEGREAVKRKARLDRVYITRANAALDLYIALRTVRVMVTGFGAR